MRSVGEIWELLHIVHSDGGAPSQPDFATITRAVTTLVHTNFHMPIVTRSDSTYTVPFKVWFNLFYSDYSLILSLVYIVRS